MAYNYLEELKSDVRNYIKEVASDYMDCEDMDELRDSLYDNLWDEDSVTGNGSGSYTFNREEAKKYVADNLDLMVEAYKEFDSRINIVENKKITAYDRIIDIFKNNIIPIDKAFVTNKCPDLSETTIERILNKLLKEDNIVKISGGRYTKYKWNN